MDPDQYKREIFYRNAEENDGSPCCEEIMKKSMILKIEGAGAVLFEQSYRAKHLNISVRPFKGVRVAVPVGFSFKKAEKIVRSKVGWIKRHQEKMKQMEKAQRYFLSRSGNVDRPEAKAGLIKRLDKLAEENGFSYNKVFVRNQKTRWGSCSNKNNISLNIKLLGLPGELMDYIILHELLHTRIKNHSKEFWTELNSLVGDAKGLQSKLKGYGGRGG